MNKMKKVKLFLAASLMVAGSFAAFANFSSNEPAITPTNDDDLRCVIRDSEGNKLAACWFCDCAAIAESLKGVAGN